MLPKVWSLNRLVGAKYPAFLLKAIPPSDMIAPFLPHPPDPDLSLPQYSNLKTELLMEYKERIKSQVHEWFANIAAQSVEISVSDKMLITNKPEDMFNIIHAQISVAHEKLPPEYVKEVGIACLQVLQDVQRQTYDMLHNQKSDGKPRSCALFSRILWLTVC